MYRPTSSRYTIGPTIELLLPFRLSVELDALYRPVEYRLLSVGATSQSIDASGSAWLFPLLAKYRLSRRFVAPYLAAGLAFNHLSGLKQLGDLDKATVSGLLPLWASRDASRSAAFPRRSAIPAGVRIISATSPADSASPIALRSKRWWASRFETRNLRRHFRSCP